MTKLNERLLASMPLGEAVLCAWRATATQERLDRVFDENRGRCYQGILTFTQFVELTADALIQHGGSGHQAFSREAEADRLAVSESAVYGKLRRMPIAVSEALLCELTDAQRELFPVEALRDPPKCLKGWEIVTLDGKSVKRVAKRLKVARGVRGGLVGGRALVAQHYATGQAMAMRAHPDGDVNDVRFVGELLPEVRRRLADRPRLWMADAQFCDLVRINRFAQQGDAFLLRYNAKVPFYRDETWAAIHGQADGRPYDEEWGWLGSPRREDRAYVRRIRLHRPGEDDVLIVTNLDDPQTYPAEELLRLYRQRWGVEQMFQKVTEVFSLANLIGTTARATIFQLAFCFLIYNHLQLIRGYIAKHQGRKSETISLYQVFYDIRRQLVAWHTIIPRSETEAHFSRLPPEAASRRLDRLLVHQWSRRWIKTTNRRPCRHPPRPRTKTHSTVHRLLQSQQH